MSTANKLTYLNTTKTKIKDAINLTGANITNDTFRSYEAKLKSGLVDIINNGTDTLYNNFPKATATGSSATLDDTYEAILKIDLKGNTSQASSPSPISPQNIQVVTGNNTITIEDSDGTNSQSYPINLGILEVRNIEGYQDYIYKSEGKWYLRNYYGKVVLDSSENWTARDNTSFSADVLRFRYDLAGVSYANMTIPGIMSNRFVGRTQDVHDLEGITRQPSVTGINVYILKSRLNGTGASAFKTWLNANNITCYYLPSSTIDTEITDTTLKGQLDALQNAMSYEGQTNINAEYTSGNQPFIMNVVALKNE